MATWRHGRDTRIRVVECSSQACFSGYRCRLHLFARLTETVDFSAENAFGIKGYSATTYGDSFADVYDEWYANLDDADFVQCLVRALPPTPVRVLELGVGTGRLVQQFLDLRDGIADTFVGVDSSQAMLDVAIQRNFPSTVTLSVADFSQSLPDGPFDVVFVGYNTLFNLPNEEAMRSCMALVAERLCDNGIFAFDVVHPIGDGTTDHTRVRSMTSDEVVLSVSRHDSGAQRIMGQFIHFKHNGTTHLRPYSVRYFSPEQLDAMAFDAGLRLESRTSDGNGTTFTDDSPRHISKYTKISDSPSILKAQ